MTRKTRAVIIGASVAGTLAGRVLSERYDEVILMDRDSLPHTAAQRSTVPQEHHVHLLLQRGKRIMERLHPGFLSELEAMGAEVVDLSHGIKWFQAGRWKNRWSTGIQAHYCTRTLVEHLLRRRVSKIANVQIMDETRVKDVVTENGAVVGVRYSSRGSEEVLMEADLVIDASGRGSRASTWLERLGYPKIECDEVVTRLGYASRIYRRNPAYEGKWKVMLLSPRLPDDRRIAVISPIENDRWMVTTGGWFGEFPDKSEESFLAFLKEMPVPDVYTAVIGAEPLSDVRCYSMPGGLRRRFDRLTDWPAGFFVLGDAVCSVNPIYSQGMSVCAMQAEALESHIDQLNAGHISAQAVQSAIVRATDLSWNQAAAGDMRFPELAPPTTLGGRVRTAYFDALISASAESRAVLMALLKVSNLVEDDKILYRPGLAFNAIKTALMQSKPTGKGLDHV